MKIENSWKFDCNFALFRDKIWLWLFYNFFALWFKDSPQKIPSNFEQKWRRDGDFSEFWYDFESGKSMSCLHFCLKWLEIFCVVIELVLIAEEVMIVAILVVISTVAISREHSKIT